MRIKSWSKKVKRRYHLEDKETDGSAVKTNVGETEWKGVDSINLALDRSQFRKLVNMVEIKFRV
jgi:hypothetical protein